MKYVLASACAEYGMKNTMKECIKNWVMDISIFWANFISFVMSGTLNEERYKDLNSLDSLIKKKRRRWLSVCCEFSVKHSSSTINYC